MPRILGLHTLYQRLNDETFLTLLFAAFCLTAVGQVTYPYNPDGNADSLIGFLTSKMYCRLSDCHFLRMRFSLIACPGLRIKRDAKCSGFTFWTVSSQQDELDMIHYLDGVSNFDGDLVSTEYITTSGSVAGGLNPTTITSGTDGSDHRPRGEGL